MERQTSQSHIVVWCLHDTFHSTYTWTKLSKQAISKIEKKKERKKKKHKMAKDTLRTAIYTLHGRIVKAKVLVKKIVFFFFKQSKQIIVAAQRPLCVSLSLACTVACSLGESVPVRGGGCFPDASRMCPLNPKMWHFISMATSHLASKWVLKYCQQPLTVPVDYSRGAQSLSPRHKRLASSISLKFFLL